MNYELENNSWFMNKINIHYSHLEWTECTSIMMGGEIMNYELENNSSFMNKIIIHYSHLEWTECTSIMMGGWNYELWTRK